MAVIGLMAHSAAAEDAGDFYRDNKQVTLYVGFGPGSGYDVWAHAIARHLGRHLAGNPVFVVRNMPGAGSVVAANFLYNVAPKDGSAIGTFSRNLPAQALIGRKGVKYDPRHFGWIGSPYIASRVCVVLASTNVRTIEDLRKHQVIMGGTGPSTAPSFVPRLLNELLGTKFKVVEGYRGAADMHLAMERGETSGVCESYATISNQDPAWKKSGKLRVLFNMESKRNPELNGTPTIFEFVKDPDKRQILHFIMSSTELGVPFVTPPGIPAGRLAALRKAFAETMTDPVFLRETAKQNLEVIPTAGADQAAQIEELYRVPKPIIERARVLMGG
jgi:tripartite-type tricarboxylate transporter receptor subunit TctC